jgi:hypothetical protein
MQDRLSDLEARLDDVFRELAEIRRRLNRLESPDAASRRAATGTPAPAPERVTPAEAARTPMTASAVGLVGRTLMALGGAYLLRAVTEMGTLPALAGVAGGLAYAVGWLFLADRAAARGERLSAVFHGTACALIAYPLIWETTTRFGLLGSLAAAGALLLVFALGLALAWRHRLGELAWLNGLFGVATAFGLMQATHQLVTFTAALLVLAALVELTAQRDLGLGLRWPVALSADLAVLQTVLTALRAGGPPPGYPTLSTPRVILVGLALPLVYLGSIAARTLLRSRAVRPFEVLQIAIAVLVGFGGTLWVVRFTGAATLAVGVFGLLLGGACYAAAFAFIERREGGGRNFYVYTTFAALLALAGARLMLGASGRALLWAALGIAGAWLGGRFERITLRTHGFVYLASAAVAAGLLGAAADGLAAGSAGPWQNLSVTGLTVGLLAAIAWGILARTGRAGSTFNALLPAAGVAALVALIGAGLAARGLARVIADAPGASADVAFLATSRTAALAGLALVLAAAGARWGRVELTWLVYPVLSAGGVKLLLEDLPSGRPVSLFVSLALYGGALFATPPLMRATRVS